MRALTEAELDFVSGGGDGCSDEGGNNFGGVTDTTTLSEDLINIDEALVDVTSHVIERVANALG